MKKSFDSAKYPKNSFLMVTFFITWLVFCGCIIYFYTISQWYLADTTPNQIPQLSRFFMIVNTFVLCLLSMSGIRQLSIILIFHLNRKRITNNGSRKLVPLDPSKVVLFLYCTCDDFDRFSIEKLKQQNYKNCRTIILDDSNKIESIEEIKKYGIENNIEVVRRPDRKGFKAGNINNFLKTTKIKYDYIVILDSDEILDNEFCNKAIPYFLTFSDIGMVQAAHTVKRSANKFVEFTKYGVFSNSLVFSSVASKYGVASSTGHGIIIAKKLLDKTNGIPEVLCEDLALSIESLHHGFRTAFANNIVCDEEFTVDYIAFKKRHARWLRGDFELLKKYFWKMMRLDVHFHEKIDIVMRVIQTAVNSCIPPLALICVCYFSIEHFHIQTVLYLSLPFILFTAFLIFNEIIFWSLKMKPHRLVIFIVTNWMLYASTTYCSYKTIVQIIFRQKKKFVVTRKTTEKFSVWECLKFNFGEVVLGLILLGSGLYVWLSLGEAGILWFGLIVYVPLLSTPFLTLLSNFKVREKTKIINY